MLTNLTFKNKSYSAMCKACQNGVENNEADSSNFKEVKRDQKGCSSGVVILRLYGLRYNR